MNPSSDFFPLMETISKFKLKQPSGKRTGDECEKRKNIKLGRIKIVVVHVAAAAAAAAMHETRRVFFLFADYNPLGHVGRCYCYVNCGVGEFFLFHCCGMKRTRTTLAAQNCFQLLL